MTWNSEVCAKLFSHGSCRNESHKHRSFIAVVAVTVLNDNSYCWRCVVSSATVSEHEQRCASRGRQVTWLNDAVIAGPFAGIISVVGRKTTERVYELDGGLHVNSRQYLPFRCWWRNFGGKTRPCLVTLQTSVKRKWLNRHLCSFTKGAFERVKNKSFVLFASSTLIGYHNTKCKIEGTKKN